MIDRNGQVVKREPRRVLVTEAYIVGWAVFAFSVGMIPVAGTLALRATGTALPGLIVSAPFAVLAGLAALARVAIGESTLAVRPTFRRQRIIALDELTKVEYRRKGFGFVAVALTQTGDIEVLDPVTARPGVDGPRPGRLTARAVMTIEEHLRGRESE